MNPAALEPVPLSPDLAPPAAAAPAGDGRRAADPADAPPAGIGAVEWRQRVDLAACYRLVALYGWDDLIFTHISARVPGPEHHFLINPYGWMFSEITASSLVKVALDGSQVDAGPHEINPAGFMIHSAIHAAREDAVCVLHVHSVNGVAVSAQEEGLLPLSQHSMFVLASLGTHDYEGVALESDEKPRLVHDLGANRFLMLRNHGLLTVGRSVAEAFVAMYFFETACMMQVRAQAGGGRLRRIGEPILRGAQAQWERVTQGAGGGLAWPALLRRLDAIDPGYRR
ncbi:MAG: class II aldolase/adducin family protein [Rubrivivax sp.]|jgi:ribulose-5-phosphate 4-epimerase/fuculose-1-phosphate aldolase|nr:class II aldolase/adducin family protein [Betaproteobacteria bacterium]MBP6320231.1 class II aldolase/adducin family protein [Rubrivivax sp.]MBK7460300.1 class II aldolase/adducin family protein [Betaproteobacteria bacterium]MBK7516224.1 class II aldolase/adducin family protein [Betaproteobacteria bacterium]MBK8107931.1 class II aldolase/adducin family protein [Betaproteobacteria bacterium]